MCRQERASIRQKRYRYAFRKALLHAASNDPDCAGQLIQELSGASRSSSRYTHKCVISQFWTNIKNRTPHQSGTSHHSPVKQKIPQVGVCLLILHSSSPSLKHGQQSKCAVSCLSVQSGVSLSPQCGSCKAADHKHGDLHWKHKGPGLQQQGSALHSTLLSAYPFHHVTDSTAACYKCR